MRFLTRPRQKPIQPLLGDLQRKGSHSFAYSLFDCPAVDLILLCCIANSCPAHSGKGEELSAFQAFASCYCVPPSPPFLQTKPTLLFPHTPTFHHACCLLLDLQFLHALPKMQSSDLHMLLQRRANQHLVESRASLIKIYMPGNGAGMPMPHPSLPNSLPFGKCSRLYSAGWKRHNVSARFA